MVAQAEPVITAIAEKIRDGQPLAEEKPGSGFMSKVLNPIMYSVMISAKAFTVTDKCIGCGKCAERCPLNNVTLSDGKPVRGKNCTHCMACIAGCPQEAVECGKKIRGKPDMEQRRVRLSAHQPRHGQPYPECADNSLHHNEFRAAAAVEITDKAEQERGQQQSGAFGLFRAELTAYAKIVAIADTSENAADIFFDAAIAMACPPMTIIFDFCPKSDSTIIIISRRIVNTFFEKTLRGRNISDKQGNDGRKTCD